MLLYVAVSIRWISIRFDFGIYNLKLFISVINEQICQGCQISIFSFFWIRDQNLHSRIFKSCKLKRIPCILNNKFLSTTRFNMKHDRAVLEKMFAQKPESAGHLLSR